jgi:anti-sigma B factor antagonist
VSADTPVRSLGLAGELTIQTAAEEKAGLLAFLDVTAAQACDVELNLADITELDTAGVQLLLMAKREARAQGRRLWLSEPSQTVVDVLGIAHLTAQLEHLSSPGSEEAGQ